MVQPRLPAGACDNHIHTKLCGHAIGEMEDYVLAAIARGLEGMVFLEHLEAGIVTSRPTWLSTADFASYLAEGKRLRAKYQGQIAIGLGIECGYNPDAAGPLRQFLAQNRWDEIGISVHYLKIEGQQEHLNLFSRREENLRLARQLGPDNVMTRYFTTLIEAVQILPGTMLCHLDGALRHVPELALSTHHYDQIEDLLQTLQRKKMALEINTSGLAIRGICFPNPQILAMARTAAIPLVLSSDAHRPENVGYHFAEAAASTFSTPC